MKIKVCKKQCIGCGLCFKYYPKIFRIDNDGLAYVKICHTSTFKNPINYKKIKNICPVNAIKIDY